MDSDLDYRTQCQLEQIKKARIAQEYYDEQQRLYERNKLKKDLEHEREKELIIRAHKSKRASDALAEIHILSERISELERIIKQETG